MSRVDPEFDKMNKCQPSRLTDEIIEAQQRTSELPVTFHDHPNP